MDPNYQVDETFAGTVAGIEDLRRKYRGNDDLDWREWKRTLVSSAKAGAKLEQTVNGLAMEFAKAARAEVVAGLITRLEMLEYHEKQRTGMKANLVRGVFELLVGALLLYVGHRWLK